jgi:hypothetical protein
MLNPTTVIRVLPGALLSILCTTLIPQPLPAQAAAPIASSSLRFDPGHLQFRKMTRQQRRPNLISTAAPTLTAPGSSDLAETPEPGLVGGESPRLRS